MDILKPLFGGFSCPIVGKFSIKDFSLSDKNLFILPAGIIRFTVYCTTNVDDMYLWLSLLFEIEN